LNEQAVFVRLCAITDARMEDRPVTRPTGSSRFLGLLLAGSLAACQAGTPATPPASAPPTEPLISAPPSTPAPTTPSAIVIEDAGVDVALAAGTYTSRVFSPHVAFELPDGTWLRSNATTDATLPLGQPASDVVLTIVRVDFVQCGETLLAHPAGAEAAALVASSTPLAGTVVADARVGDRPAHAVDLPGTGTGGGGDIDPADGCILTSGPEPFPAEYGWVVVTSDVPARMTFVDVGGRLVLVMGRSTSEGLDGVVAATAPVAGSVRFPDDPAGA
jgi:hypothetical protein